VISPKCALLCARLHRKHAVVTYKQYSCQDSRIYVDAYTFLMLYNSAMLFFHFNLLLS